jgi:hypothetical protein
MLNMVVHKVTTKLIRVNVFNSFQYNLMTYVSKSCSNTISVTQVSIQDSSLHITFHPSFPNPVSPFTSTKDRQAYYPGKLQVRKTLLPAHIQMLGFSLTLFRFFLSLSHSHPKRPIVFQTVTLQI